MSLEEGLESFLYHHNSQEQVPDNGNNCKCFKETSNSKPFTCETAERRRREKNCLLRTVDESDKGMQLNVNLYTRAG